MASTGSDDQDSAVHRGRGGAPRRAIRRPRPRGRIGRPGRAARDRPQRPLVGARTAVARGRRGRRHRGADQRRAPPRRRPRGLLPGSARHLSLRPDRVLPPRERRHGRPRAMGQERPRPAPPRQGVRRAPRGEQPPVDPRDGPAQDPERPRRLPRVEALLRFDEARGRGRSPLVPDLPARRQRRPRRLHVLLLAPAGHLPGRARRRVSEDRGPALGHRREGAPHLRALRAEGGPGDPKPLHHPRLRPLSLGRGRRAAPRDPRRPSPRGRETGRDGRHDGPQGIHRDGRADSAGERAWRC